MHSAYSTIRQADFDASGMIAPGKKIGNSTRGELASGLICFEDDVDEGAIVQLGHSRDVHSPRIERDNSCGCVSEQDGVTESDL